MASAEQDRAETGQQPPDPPGAVRPDAGDKDDPADGTGYAQDQEKIGRGPGGGDDEQDADNHKDNACQQNGPPGQRLGSSFYPMFDSLADLISDGRWV